MDNISTVMSQRARPGRWKKRGSFACWVGCSLRAWVVCLAIGVVATGCEKVTTETIERWKGTAKGPDKLQDALNSHSLDPELRAKAAVALQSLGRAEFVAKALQSMPDRPAVVTALVKLDQATLAEESNGAQDARDSLFALRPYTEGAERQSVDQALMAAIERQMTAGGKLGGSQSLSKIVEALDAQSVPTLVKLMALPKAPHAELAELLAKVGDAASKDRAGDALLVVAKKSRVVEPGIWRALGLLASPAVVTYLQEQVDRASWQQAQQAARALQLQPHPQLADFSVSRAANGKLHGNVREEMFGLAGTCCGDATVPGLSNIIRGASGPLVKYRAYEAILSAAGPKGIDAGLDGFGPKSSYMAQDVDDFLVKETEKLGPPAHAAVLRLLGSASPLKRLVAVLSLQKLGSSVDVRQLNGLAADKGLVKGLPASRSVGREATRIASLLAKRA